MSDPVSNGNGREALRGAEVETLDLLFEALTSEQWMKLLKSALQRAAFFGNRDLARKLVRAGAAIGEAEALYWAILGGYGEIVDDLLDSGASPAVKDRNGLTPLHVAASHGETEIVQRFLLKGADVDAADRNEITPLHVAALYNNAEAIHMLVEAGANIEARDFHGDTPLHCASIKISREALLCLLKHGATVNAQGGILRTPLMHAARNAGGAKRAAEVVDSLLRAGADEAIVDGPGRIPVDVIGEHIKEDGRLAEDVERVRELLANAPADRSWRRRGYLVLCRAHPNRARQVQVISGTHHTCTGRKTRSRAKLPKARGDGAGDYCTMDESTGGDWAAVTAKVLRLQEEGLFQTIVGYI